MSDFDDLFGSSAGRVQSLGSSASPAGSPRTATLRASPPGGFATSDWDDGFSSNPFADLQSNSIAGFPSAPGVSPPGARAHSNGSFQSPTSRATGLSNDGLRLKQHRVDDDHARHRSGSTPSLSTRTSYASGAEGEIDRVVVSPIASRTMSEVDMLRAPHSSEEHSFRREEDLPRTAAAGPSLHASNFETSNSPWTDDISYSAATETNGEVDRNLPYAAASNDFANPNTSSPLADSRENDLRPRNLRGDSASIRTVVLESEIGSIHSQPGALIKAETSSPAPPLQDDVTGRPNFIITVEDPTKVSAALSLGDALTSHTVYTIRTRTSSTYFKKHDFSVLRRYSDFLWLIERLNANNPGIVAPALPGKIIVGRFSQGVVESRRLALQDCLQHIVRHQLLATDPDLRIFLESDAFYTESRQRAAVAAPLIASDLGQNAASRLFSIPGLTSPRFVEFDDFFATRKAQIDGLEVALKAMSHSLSIALRTTASTNSTAAEVAASIHTLSACELGKNAIEAILHLSRLQSLKAETASIVGGSMEVDLLATFDTFIRLIGSIRTAFQSRVKMYHSWQRAEAATRAAQSAHERAKRQSRINPDLVTLALADVTEAERAAISAKREFEDSTSLLKRELGRIDEEKTETCRRAVLRYTVAIAERQATVVEAWKAYVTFLETSTPAQKGEAQGGAKDSDRI